MGGQVYEVIGDYALKREIGAGANGRVCSAWLNDAPYGVIKIFDDSDQGRATAKTEKLRLEANAKNAGVVELLDHDVDPEQGPPYLVLSRIDGWPVGSAEARYYLNSVRIEDRVELLLNLIKTLHKMDSHTGPHGDLHDHNVLLHSHSEGSTLVVIDPTDNAEDQSGLRVRDKESLEDICELVFMVDSIELDQVELQAVWDFGHKQGPFETIGNLALFLRILEREVIRRISGRAGPSVASASLGPKTHSATGSDAVLQVALFSRATYRSHIFAREFTAQYPESGISAVGGELRIVGDSLAFFEHLRDPDGLRDHLEEVGIASIRCAASGQVFVCRRLGALARLLDHQLLRDVVVKVLFKGAPADWCGPRTAHRLVEFELPNLLVKVRTIRSRLGKLLGEADEARKLCLELLLEAASISPNPGVRGAQSSSALLAVTNEVMAELVAADACNPARRIDFCENDVGGFGGRARITGTTASTGMDPELKTAAKENVRHLARRLKIDLDSSSSKVARRLLSTTLLYKEEAEERLSNPGEDDGSLIDAPPYLVLKKNTYSEALLDAIRAEVASLPIVFVDSDVSEGSQTSDMLQLLVEELGGAASEFQEDN